VGRCPTPRRERGSLDPVLAKRSSFFKPTALSLGRARARGFSISDASQ